MTRDADDTMSEELRQAIESERLWDHLPPEIEERLARRIGDSLASVGAAESREPKTAPGEPEPPSVATRRRTLPTVFRTASASLRWGIVFAGGLVAAGAMGAGLVVAIKSAAPSPSVDAPSRGPRAPVRKGGPRAPRSPPPAPAEAFEVPPTEPELAPPAEEAKAPPAMPELAPLPPAPPPSPQKPAAPSWSKVKRVPPPSPVAPKPEVAPPSPTRRNASPVSERDWSLLKLAREASAQGRYREALSAVTQHEREYPSSQLEQEREALRIHALMGLGQREEARALASSFERNFPESMLLEGIREAVGEE